MAYDKTYHVYIMTNTSRTSNYTGVTSNLYQRVWQHREGIYGGFSGKYRTNILVYYEATTDVWAALEREKQIKRWRREKKVALIKSLNPRWRDLAIDLGFPPLSQKSAASSKTRVRPLRSR